MYILNVVNLVAVSFGVILVFFDVCVLSVGVVFVSFCCYFIVAPKSTFKVEFQARNKCIFIIIIIIIFSDSTHAHGAGG